MLNTFRVIFVDHDGFVISNPATCGYDQSSTRGYYSIDHGQPTGIAGNYAYDNRSINDWYRKYGTRNPEIPDGGDASLFPPNRSVNERVKLEGKTGGLMASAGMTSPGKDIFGVGGNLLLPQGTPDPDAGNQYSDNDNKGGPEWLYMRKDYGVTLDLRTPSYFFTENGSIRNINKTKAINFDDTTTKYDLKFDTNPSSPVQDNEIDLSQDPNDYPKWIYIGLVGAGGPAGARIQTIQDANQGFCAPVVGDGSKTIGLCDSWFNNRNLTATGDIGTQIPNFSTYIMSQNYSGLQSAAGQGGRAGIFLKACQAPNNSNGTRRTVVVRLLNLGKGGVETFNNDIRAFNENADAGDDGINKAKTVFPTYDQRKTKVEVYISNENDSSLGDDDKLLTIEVDGGKASIMQLVQVSADCTNQSTGYRESYCADCGDDFEVSGTVGNTDCINATPDKFSNEIYDSSTTDPPPSEDNRAPAFTITEGTYARNNPSHYEWKEAIPFSSCPINQTDPCGIPSIADPIFPQEFIDQGIIEQSDWFSTAGGIQESLKTVEATLDSNEDFFGLGDDFIFYGNTEYVFEQILDAEQFIIIPPLPQNQVIPSVEYFVKDTEGGEYSVVGVDFYKTVDTANTYSVKVVLTFSPNSLFDVFQLTNNNPNFPPTFEFEFRRSTDQLLARPGLPGVMKATMVYGGTDLSVGENDFTEGVGGNGGGVFVGWGDHVNTAAEPSEEAFKLVPGSGFGMDIIQPNAISHTNNRILFAKGTGSDEYVYKQYNPDDPFYKRITLGYGGDYGQVGDSTAKGYDVAPVARFTEMPETTREGDFFVTLSAYHMEGIHKVTFIMDGGDPIDVYEPIAHPDSLGTDYNNTASGLGKGYREYMVRVDTSNMTHNTAHEIRAIVWPNSGYPLLLQGEKVDRARMQFSNNNWSVPEQTNDEMKKYRVSPTIFPWVSNTYPDYMCDFTPQNGTNDTVYTTPPEEDDEGKYLIIKDDPQFQTDLEWKARPGGVIDNFEGHVDDDGNPAWWIDGAIVNSVSYHGFWFRYQDSAQRKNVYIDPSYTGNASDGSRENPYKDVDDFMDDKLIDVSGQTTKVVDPAFYSARVLLMATNTNGVYDNNSVPQTHKYFSSNNPIAGSQFQNALDNSVARSAAQNPSCQVLTVEADPQWIFHTINRSRSIPNGYWNPELETTETNNEIFMFSNDGGWGKNNNQDDNGGDLRHSSVHFRNLRFISDNPSDNQASLFQTSNPTNNLDTHYWVDGDGNEERLKIQTIIVDSCRINSYSDLAVSSQFNYLDGNGRRISNKVQFPGFIDGDPGQNTQIYDDVDEVPTDRSEMRSVVGPLPVVWEKLTSNNRRTKKKINGDLEDVIVFRRIWDGDRFPSDNDIISPNLRTDILKDPKSDTGYKDYLVNWTPGDPTLDVDGKTPDEFPNGLYKSQLVDTGRNNDNEGIRNFGFVEGDDVFCLKQDSEAGTPVWYVDDGGLTVDPDTGKLDNVLLQPVGGVNPDTEENTMGPGSIEGYSFAPLGTDPLNGEAEGVPTKRTEQSPGFNSGSYGRKMLEGDFVNNDTFCFNSNVSSYQAARRFTGVNTVKHYVETNSEGDTAARATACILNLRSNIRNINMYSGKRVLTNSINTVHGDFQQYEGSDKHWLDNRMVCDLYSANNATQLSHQSLEGGIYRRNSQNDYWRSGHRTRNIALVNIITDTVKSAATWNYYENTDHLYVRGWRAREGTFAHRIEYVAGLPLFGEKYDVRSSHVYFADMQQGSFAWKIRDDSGDKLQPAKLLDGIDNPTSEYAGWVRENPNSYTWEEGDKKTYPFAWDTTQENGSGTYKPTEWDEANDLRWIPVYTAPADNDNVDTDISNDPQMGESDTAIYDNANAFENELRKSMRNSVIMENSNFNFGSHIFIDFGGGGSKVTERLAMKSKEFGEANIPSMDVAYLPNDNTPSGDAKIGAIGAPRGIPAPAGEYADADEKRTIKCIPTIVGSPEEIKTLYQGFSGPVNVNNYTWVDDNGNWLAPQWTTSSFDTVESRYVGGTGLQGGDIVKFYYPYSMYVFFDLIRDGGWNYTDHWSLADYTPHKL